MTHLGEGTLQELLDDELAPDLRGAADRHLAACAACAGELAELRAGGERASALLGLADVPAPVLRAQAGFHRRRRAGGPLAGAGRALPRAAAIALTLAVAGVAAAVPGSPVRGWLGGETVEERPAEPVRLERAPEAPPAAVVPLPKAVSIFPDAGRVRVVVSGSSPELRVRTRLTDGPNAEVHATGSAASARFRTAPGRIEVVGAGPGEVVVHLPASARAAFLEVNGRVYAAKEGAVLRSLQPRVDGSAAEPVFRAGP
ncbi:MAG TPA: hypothetical protein VGB24_22425 [Longimicrobium sp.]|jgi:hypothetical protein|uniref:anti-sigma factor family protein n=1 Tax=Longimicrobium sp. TaxID=2029185 RepID=UPI002ED90DFE